MDDSVRWQGPTLPDGFDGPRSRREAARWLPSEPVYAPAAAAQVLEVFRPGRVAWLLLHPAAPPELRSELLGRVTSDQIRALGPDVLAAALAMPSRTRPVRALTAAIDTLGVALVHRIDVPAAARQLGDATIDLLVDRWVPPPLRAGVAALWRDWDGQLGQLESAVAAIIGHPSAPGQR